jgi:glucose/arabinose dehydrogenase
MPGADARLRGLWVRAILLLLAMAATALPAAPAPAAPPQGFSVSTVFGGLAQPTALAFAPDGRVFVAEKGGIVKLFDNVTDTTPDVFADLQANVHDVGERGLLGLAINPNFPADPYVHVLYAYDAPIGGTAPAWNDTCGPTGESCPASARLSRLRAEGSRAVAEEVLIEDWCSTGKFHTVAGLAFGSDGALYASAGDGSHAHDYGQLVDPPNACGDPPVGVGEEQKPPSAEGGALRAQDLRTPGDPVTLDGTFIRVDPATGRALPDNPSAPDPDANIQRIIAYGFREPFRFAVRPGTTDLWMADVGTTEFEELNRIPAVQPGAVPNYGWPCYEGAVAQPDWEALGLTVCADLYNQPGAVTPPVLAFRLTAPEGCATSPQREPEAPLVRDAVASPAGAARVGPGTQSLSALAFYQGGAYPDTYDGVLFLGDYARQCLWVMRPGAGGEPDPGTLEPFATDVGSIVDLQVGPDGDLFYVHIGDAPWRAGPTGEVRRLSYTG